MTKQRILKDEIGDFEMAGGITEHENEFLPRVSAGKKSLDPGFETIYDYELLDPLVELARAEFKTDTENNIQAADLIKINEGLASYIKSSASSSRNLKILKASILQALGEDLLTGKYELEDDGLKQLVPESYFEDLRLYFAINNKELISSESIRYYQEKAIRLTIRVMSEFTCLQDDDQDFDDLEVFRGQGNYSYYLRKRKENFADGLSTYTGIGEESVPFFERQLFNSYTINRRLAEHFMVMGNNNRKYMLSTGFRCVVPNLFSSFIVSALFDDGQYEMLCLPNRNELYITEHINNEVLAEFHVNDYKTGHPDLPLPTRDDILNIPDE